MPVPVGWAQGWEDCRHGNGGWGRRAGWGRFGAVLLGVIMFSACGGSLRVPSAPRSVVTLRLTGRAAGSVVAASLLVAVPLPRSARPTSAVPSSYLTTPAQSPASDGCASSRDCCICHRNERQTAVYESLWDWLRVWASGSRAPRAGDNNSARRHCAICGPGGAGLHRCGDQRVSQ